MTQAQKIAQFRALHESGLFVMPNPWDLGSAAYLQSLGFKALATTSLGYAFSIAKPDFEWAVTRDEMLAHIASMAAGTTLPLNADFESGYAHDPDGVHESVRLCVEAGVAGLSIEDNTGDKARPLYGLHDAVARIRAARAAIDASGLPVVLTGRAECWLVGHPEPLAESTKRLVAYAEAGADCLYAPGVRKPEEIAALVKAVAPKPFNLLIGAPGVSARQAQDLGVRRISVGGALARVAWAAFMRVAGDIAREGTFGGLAGIASAADLNALFRARR
ncbi:isocitrate lyase/phosphoenolpyruvate mutase family protein [Vineibacter terrae]|uniref:Isocitrate lyase/phosphoenolpyruvate mutase family protein n=1 Tax=Vineibacter terrae TaxID=2586908 RepID=A0A5C8PI39_9HYPH|nr:isocitrate lyase/phosphoenolpyruvate mutase family protein [Vineibacter terrae]TXL73005.1 isocitrate lyase/phosphoenolpyruvate mutase family protein [Vineibacter terrae]